MQEFSTPMMQQYMQIKAEYPDCLLLFRLGDFYELFLDDALVGARILDIVLTKRPRGKDGDIPMAGVPYHAADIYINKLVKAGYKVALCEQVSEPNPRGLVERKVVRIVTPGTILDEKALHAKQHNYTLSIALGDTLGLAWADASTGDFQVTEYELNDDLQQILHNEITKFNPTECILSDADYNNPQLLNILSQYKTLNIFSFGDWDSYAKKADKVLKDHFKVKTLKSFGLPSQSEALKAAGSLFGYLLHTQKSKLSHFITIVSYDHEDHVGLDASTIANLELFSTIRDNEEHGSLVHTIDRTITAMGGRQLRTWLRNPLRKKALIEARFDAVAELMQEAKIRTETKKEFLRMYDLERILARLSAGIGTPHDLLNLKTTIFAGDAIAKLVVKTNSTLLHTITDSSKKVFTLAEKIQSHITDMPLVDPKAGGLIRSGVDSELDTIRESIRESKEWIVALEAKERTRTGINSLKVKFTSVFGYYIEISRANLDAVPSNYIRKQTTVNAERFITKELEVYEEHVLRGEDKIKAREYQIFLTLVAEILEKTHELRALATHIATIDCLRSFAEKALEERYIRPVLTTTTNLSIDDGRHPVVEELLKDHSFVPNNTRLNDTDQKLIIITGPNMAGKSVYMRQVAVIVLLAHIGCFIPARRAEIGLVDRIFVRSGAADSISRGLSTFMVEMVETAYILHHATSKSLVIMDEIGRGTSTYDGISIAWAVAEYLVKTEGKRPKTLFATHYHELQALEKEYPAAIKNYHMAIEASGENPVFLYRFIKGGAHGSYAIAVAKLAGIPADVTKRAEELLKEFDTEEK